MDICLHAGAKQK